MNSTTAALFLALSDETRLNVLEVLARRPQTSVEDIVTALHQPRPTISYALQVLRRAGIVDFYEVPCAGRGVRHEYYIVPESMETLAETTKALSPQHAVA